MPSLRRRVLALAVILVSASLVLAACGDDEAAPPAAGTEGEAAERAFLSGMVPHHESAVAMAEVAQRRAQAPEIMELANEISDAQEAEIAQMGEIHQRLFGEALVPDEGAHEALGLTAEEAGMGHMDAATMLEAAEPFDRAFVDEMVGHHRGAIAMAEALLPQTDDAELRELAEGIIEAQRTEIDRMNAFRQTEYGGPVPEGGADGAGTEMESPGMPTTGSERPHHGG